MRQRQIRRAKAYGRWEAPNVPALGTQRRLQALVHRGWSQAKLAERLEFSPQRIYQLMHTATVAQDTATRVDRLFRELWHREPPQAERYDRLAYERAKRHARRRGWVGPLDWDDIDTDEAPAAVERAKTDVDESNVELALTGSTVTLTRAERRVAVRTLHGYGLTDPEIAARIGCSDRTVLRIRDELELPPVDNPHTTPARQAA